MYCDWEGYEIRQVQITSNGILAKHTSLGMLNSFKKCQSRPFLVLVSIQAQPICKRRLRKPIMPVP